MEAGSQKEGQQNGAVQKAGSNSGWYFTWEKGTSGPVDDAVIAAYLTQGYVTSNSMIWREGQEQWLPLSAIPQLSHLAKLAAPATQEPPNQHATQAPPQQQPSQEPATSSNAPVDPGVSALQAFADDIRALDASVNLQFDAAPTTGSEGKGTRSSAPPTTGAGADVSDEQFVDDDGTLYKWDAAVGKYVAQAEGGGGGGGGEYDVSLMTYDFQPENQPDYQEELRKRVEDEEGQDEDDDTTVPGSKRRRPPSDVAHPQKSPKHPEHPGNTSATQTDAQQSDGSQTGPGGSQTGPGGWFELKHNSNVYVRGLPLDTDVEELKTFFSKCGIIKMDENNNPKIKIYRDKLTGRPKGDALVTYLKEASVQIATTVLNGSPLRYDKLGHAMHVLTVERAKFEQKGGTYQGGANAGGEEGPKRKQQNNKGGGGRRGGLKRR